MFVVYSSIDIAQIKYTANASSPMGEFILQYGEVFSHWLELFNKALAYYSNSKDETIPHFEEVSTKYSNYNRELDKLVNLYSMNDLPLNWEVIYKEVEEKHPKCNPLELFIREFSKGAEWRLLFISALNYFKTNMMLNYTNLIKNLIETNKVEY